MLRAAPVSLLALPLAVVVACGGKVQDDGRAGGAGGEGTVEEPALPAPGGRSENGGAAGGGSRGSVSPSEDPSEPIGEPGDPSQPHANGADASIAMDPSQSPFERCQAFCELPEVQCQKSFGGSVAGCTEGCTTTAVNMDSEICQEMYFELMVCLEDIAVDIACREDFERVLTDSCAELVAAHADECLTGFHLSPHPE